MGDSLGYDKNCWIVFLAKYPFNLKKYANYQSPLKSSFDPPFYLTSLRASQAKPHMYIYVYVGCLSGASHDTLNKYLGKVKYFCG